MKINPAEYTILVVDDVQSNILLLNALLGKEGFKILNAMNGKDALNKVKSHAPDLILLDVMMPEMDGFEVAGRLKIEPRFADTPIIFLTALNDSASVVKGFQLGASDFISKPFRREELLIRVEHQLSLVDARRIITRQTEELRKTIAGRDKLYSVIAHDLRSPMASIKMLSNAIMLNISPKDMCSQTYEMIEMANKTSEELFVLMDNLLKWTKCQIGRLTYMPQSFEMAGLIKSIIENLKPISDNKNITIQLETYKDIIEIDADVEMISSVIRNLLSNAIKYSYKNSTVTVFVEKVQSDEILIRVVDYGIGIKKEDHSKLMDEVSHYTTYGTNSEGGSGLGLLVCKDFIQKHEGRLWFNSDENQGSEFCFTLPIK